MAKYFGTDGIRGVAGTDLLSPTNVFFFGRAIGHALNRAGGTHHRRRVMIGRDTRLSGPEIAAQLTAGLRLENVEVVDLGVISTPGVAFLARQHQVDAGIVISASHNPAADNGIKVFGPDGNKASDELETAIEAAFDALTMPAATAPTATAAPTEWPRIEAAPTAPLHDAYVADLIQRGGGRGALKGLKIVLDCAHGAASELAPRVFEGLGASVIPMFCEPTGTNINDGCGALCPERVAPQVAELGADLGFAFDGDADRCIAIDEAGAVRDGDYCLAIWGRYLAEAGQLPGRAVVTTIMANIGLELSLREAGIGLERTAVGDKYVAARMLETGFVLGGEQSGHILFFGPLERPPSDRPTTGDGILTAVYMAQIVRQTGRSLGDWSRCLTKYPQILINVPVTSKPELSSVPAVAQRVRMAETDLAGRGRIVLRYSGTEALARVMVEGPTHDLIALHAEAIAGTIRDTIGAAGGVKSAVAGESGR